MSADANEARSVCNLRPEIIGRREPLGVGAGNQA